MGECERCDPCSSCYELSNPVLLVKRNQFSNLPANTQSIIGLPNRNKSHDHISGKETGNAGHIVGLFRIIESPGGYVALLAPIVLYGQQQ